MTSCIEGDGRDINDVEGISIEIYSGIAWFPCDNTAFMFIY